MKHHQSLCRHGGMRWQSMSPLSETGSEALSLRNTQQGAAPAGRRGFTLLEIMIVVIIIGLLAILAVPAFREARTSSQNSRMINDFRQYKAAFETYTLENGDWPQDVTPGVLPNEMQDYILEDAFESRNFVDGYWDWDEGVFGITAGIALRNANVNDEQMTEVDKALDDGDLATGKFRSSSGGGYILILEE